MQLTIAGALPPVEVKRLAGDGVKVTGWVPDLAPVMAGAEVVVAPVRVGGGMRMKVLEAMACGKAVVTTPRGAEGLAVNERTPPLMVADDAPGIAAACLALLADSDRRRRLGDDARAFASECHGSAAYAARLERVYREAAPSAA